MSSSYYDKTGKEVYDGDVIYANDVNTINEATDTAFSLVEQAIGNVANTAEYYSNLAEQWAEEPEDSQVVSGKYSALHHAAKAEDSATTASTAASTATTKAGEASSSASSASTSASTATTKAAEAVAAIDTMTGLVATHNSQVGTAVHGLGTASTLTATTSTTDGTAGRVLRVGDWGIGVTQLSQGLPTIDNDFDEATINGLYSAPNGVANAPIGGQNFGLLVISSLNANNVTQIAFSASNSAGFTQSWIRARQSGVWGSWRKILDSVSNPITTSTSDQTTGRLLKVGDFGIGGSAVTVTGDANDINGSGLYTGFNLTNNPTAGWVVYRQYKYNDLYKIQVATPVNQNHAYIRVQENGTWEAWTRLLSLDDRTSSTTDSTIGKLLKVGDFGLGAISSPAITSPVTLGTTLVSGMYYVNNVLGMPESTYGQLEVKTAVGARTVQMFRPLTAGNLSVNTYIRFSADNGSSWTLWELHYTQKNILGTVSQSGGIPTGAIIERGSNANGTYIKYADGTMICYKTGTFSTIPASGTANDSWTFPVAFASLGYVKASLDYVAGAANAVFLSEYTLVANTAVAIYGYNVGASDLSTPPYRYYAIGKWF